MPDPYPTHIAHLAVLLGDHAELSDRDRRELRDAATAWAEQCAARAKALPVVYVAHALSAQTVAEMAANREAARRWATWVATTFRVAVVADWLWMSESLEETPENRALGLECDCALVARCDVLVMVGPRVSDGMRRESERARAVVDWTWLSPPRAVALAMIDGPAIARLRDELFAAIEGARG